MRPRKPVQEFTRRISKRNLPDISEITYKNTELLNYFVDSAGKILGSKLTGFDPKRQRKLQKSIKRARSLGLMSFVGRGN
jgi:small subunit ribosomal protein S18